MTLGRSSLRTRRVSSTPWRAAALLGAMLSAGPWACDGAGPGSFPPEDPALADANAAAGDLHRGRFPFADAVAGLPDTGIYRATIVSDEGPIHCQLYADVAPLAVANFIGLARGLRPFLDPATQTWVTRPYYDALGFHRAQERQFVQGGRLNPGPGPNSSPTPNQTPFIGFRLQDEPSIGSAFDRPGILALANEGRPNTSAGELFITTEVLRQLDGHYTIIGRCDDLLVVRALEARVLAGEVPVIETVTITRE